MSWHQEAGAHPQPAEIVGSIIAEGRAERVMEGVRGTPPCHSQEAWKLNQILHLRVPTQSSD